MNTRIYKGHTIYVRKSSFGKVIQAVVLRQNAQFKTIKSAKAFVDSIS